jgi:hypothetical protein
MNQKLSIEVFEAKTMNELMQRIATRFSQLTPTYTIHSISQGLVYDGKFYYANLILFMTERDGETNAIS